MTATPFNHLLVAAGSTVAIAGPHIQTLDSRTGNLIAATTAPAPIRVAALDNDATYLITAGDDKILRLWKVEGLEPVNERELPKRPTALGFTKDGKTIVVGDKFGDVFTYPLEHIEPTTEEKNKALASHENPSGGRLILGHVSLLTAFLLSPDEKYIITADRDEHIRVSWYPQGYTIESYCLGHTKFVSAIHIPEFAQDTLISGGGDSVLKVWDWLSGRLIRDIAIADAVEPYIVVKPEPKIPRRFGDGEGSGKKKNRKGKKRARDQKAAAESALVLEEPEQVDEVESLVFAISQIATTPSKHVLFSACGATALFCVPFSDTDAEIGVLDFGKPVLTFAVQADGLIYVSLDGNYGSDTTSMVRTVKIDENKLVAVTSTLITTLNTTALKPATPAELSALELYAALTSLPKGRDVDTDPMERPGDDGDFDAVAGLSKKELGRLKSKKAVAKRVGDEDEQRETKRARSEQDDQMDEDEP
ncbi:tRNA (guanine-N(7)-)-methyltransferase non-catalytic subunit TRM82 [Mycena kentingensis (nom. inval.)]|nr:tRNA (guanine-N(7)-)-methyltransferase non-catalytic subunit TRM82 [Mycena kentingensis (nom. inval.)]